MSRAPDSSRSGIAPASAAPLRGVDSVNTDEAFDEPLEYVAFEFGLSRREFVQTLGAGLLVTILVQAAPAQRRSGGARRGRDSRGSSPRPVAARVHIGNDGTITVMTGKVEGGQGARAELTQAAAEELRLPADRVQLLMADTALVPDDGLTAGSRSTPSSVPAVRQGCAAARGVLVKLAAERWKVEPGAVDGRDGQVVHAATGRTLKYAELATGEEASKAFQQMAPADVELTRVGAWKVLGTPVRRPNGQDIVTGSHAYPSDIVRPEMLYGKVLRPPSYGAKLTSIDTERAKAMPGVTVVRENSFVAVAAPNTHAAEQALKVLADAATWAESPQRSSDELFKHLRDRARNVPTNPYADQVKAASKHLRATYNVAYVQHAPLEPRAAVAEWQGKKLTVWTSTQNPFGVRSELARTLHVAEEDVRVIVPDFGAGFGGKHTGETAVEAARMARETKRPVCLRWTRAEEFTWAYFRPAAVIEVEASLDGQGTIDSWHFVNINSGGSAVNTPYAIEKAKGQFVESEPPLRHGSYRALAATANNFARECFMDELAGLAVRDPLEFRLAHLKDERLRAVLEAAAKRFGWHEAVSRKDPNISVGLACGTEKGSYVAACVEVEINASENQIRVRRVCEAFECGAILNPVNLDSQVRGCIVMGLGPALREAMEFENGRILNAAFRKYKVPRFEDIPAIDVELLNRTDLPSVGAGETPIIAIAPAIANAVSRSIGTRVREMPIELPAKRA